MMTVCPSSALNSLTQLTCTCTRQSTNCTGFAQVRKINSLRLSPNLNSPLLFKITKNPSISLPGMMLFTSPVTFPIWGFYYDICDCHILPVRALMSAPTYALSRKVLSLTKPKDKIYKTKNDSIKKSFRNYITHIQHLFLCKFCMVCNFQVSKIWWQSSVQALTTLICHHFKNPQNKYFCKIKLIFTINQYQIMPSLHFWGGG